MRTRSKIILFSIAVLGLYVVFAIFFEDDIVRAKNFKLIQGHYRLDVHKTNLSDYRKDSALYSHLTLDFYADSTFRLNMDVPFFHNSVGRWTAKGASFGGFSTLRYKEWGDHDVSHISNFDGDNDSSLCISSEPGKKNAKFIQDIYFIKDMKR